MNDQRKLIAFHPRRLSHSHSKDKYSPYRRQKSKDKNQDPVENRQKMALQEPIIKFKSLINGHPTNKKLQLNSEHEQEPQLTCTTNYSNYGFREHPSYPKNQPLVQLIETVERQQENMNRNFREIREQLRFPRLVEKEEIRAQEQKMTQYEQNQQKILKNLEALNYFSTENKDLKSLVQSYEQEIAMLNDLLDQKKDQCLYLLQELSMLKIIGLVDTNLSSQRRVSKSKDAAEDSRQAMDKILSENIVPKEAEQQLFLSLGHQQRKVEKEYNFYEELLQRKEKEIAQLKLQNQILTEEVKLLNYTIEQKEAHIAKLTRERKKATQHDIPDNKKNSTTIITSGNKSHKNSSTSSILKRQSEQQPSDIVNQSSIRTKKTNSIMFIDDETAHNKANQLHGKPEPHKKIQRRQTSIEKIPGQLLASGEKATSGKKTSGNDRYNVEIRKKASDTDKKKIDMGRSYLKIKAKGTHDALKDKQSGKKDSWIFNDQKMRQLQVLRTTIGYKLKGFRYRYVDLLAQLLNHTAHTIQIDEIRKYFSVYPFLLSDYLIEDIVSFLLKKYPKNKDEIQIDQFCHILRELNPHYEILGEEVEKLAVGRIRDLIEGYERQLVAQLRGFQEEEEGVVSYKCLKTVLKQFRVGQAEVQLIISQCCIISTDCDHLNYEQYFSLYKLGETQHNL